MRDVALIRLGEQLFYSPDLSGDGSVACVTCHDPRFALSGPTRRAVGIRKQMGKRHAPPLFNLAGLPLLMSDGRAQGLFNQPHMPLEASDEMAIEWPKALKLVANLDESRRFLLRDPTHQINQATVLAALSSYIGSLVSGGSSFDRYYYQNDELAISEDAKQGLVVFVRKARCATCHLLTGASAPFTDANFHSIGIGWKDGKYADQGRYDVTKNATDIGLFKTPTLRNVAVRPFLMHDGSMTSLREVINYYNRGGNHEAENLDKRLAPLYLSESDINHLIAFLNTLTAPVVSYRLSPH